MGYAMLIAESPASPIELPTKKPSTMAYTPESAKDNTDGITYRKKVRLLFTAQTSAQLSFKEKIEKVKNFTHGLEPFVPDCSINLLLGFS